MTAIEQREGYVLLRVRVQPRASRDAVRVEADGRIRVALTAPPVEGEANAALRAFLAKTLGLAKGAVSLAAGGKSRDKTLRVEGVQAKDIAARLGV